MADIFLGIDGGGSKTTAVMADSKGKTLSTVCGDSINYYSIGLDNAKRNMKNIIDKLMIKTNETRFKGAFIGMSALNGEATPEELDSFVSGIINSEKTGMNSDLFVALEALSAGGEGSVVISGTGSMAIARNEQGKVSHAGGWGHILGDEGSGYSLALEAIRAGIRGFEGSLPATELTDAVKKHFKIGKMEDLIALFYDPPMERKKIAAFAKALKLCAENGDKTALSILENGAEELAKTALSLIKSMNKEMPIGLWGGIFQNIPLFKSSFIAKLEKEGFSNIAQLPLPPEKGALIAAYKLWGIEPNDEMRKNLSE